MKRALITGINGMDGSHLADFLLEKDYIIYIKKLNTSIKSLHFQKICVSFEI